MLTLPRKSLLAGMICILLGAFVAWRGYGYSIGTLSAIGAGFFPAILGVMLVLCGIGLVLQNLRDGDIDIQINLRPYLAIPGAIIVFALTIDRFGLLPSVLLATLIASLANRDSGTIPMLVLAGVLMAATYAIFVLVLRIPLQPVMWRL